MKCIVQLTPSPGLCNPPKKNKFLSVQKFMERLLPKNLHQASVYWRKLREMFSLPQLLRYVWACAFHQSLMCVRLRTFPLPIWLRPRSSDIRVAFEIFITRELEMPWPLAQAPTTIIDGGANVGYATLALKHRWPDAFIVAVEPDLDNCIVLRKNVQSLSNVVLLQKGIWGSQCHLRVKTDPAAAAWSLQFEPVNENTPGSVGSETVSDLIGRLPGNHCDLLKLDIEGAETNIFSQPDLSWIGQVSVILIETHGAAARSVVCRAADRFGLKVSQAGEKIMLSR